jgi:hypothetical protein
LIRRQPVWLLRWPNFPEKHGTPPFPEHDVSKKVYQEEDKKREEAVAAKTTNNKAIIIRNSHKSIRFPSFSS